MPFLNKVILSKMIKDRISYRILIVEDNPNDFFIINEYLLEYIVNPIITYVDTFKKATHAINSEESNFDVILLDLALSDMDKNILFKEILKVFKSIPVIILTGHGDIDFSIKSISNGISDYLIKDELTPSALYKSIVYAIERRKLFFRISESEKKYSDLFHFSPEPMWVYDIDTLRFLDVNHAATDKYGFDRGDFFAMTINDIRPPEEVIFLKDILANSQKNNYYKFHGFMKHKTKDGKLINVEIYSTSIHFGNIRARVVLASDITERMIQMELIQRQNKDLKEIAWIQSHVVRAPLAKMMGIVNLMKKHKETSPHYEELLNHFLVSADEIDNIIKEIS